MSFSDAMKSLGRNFAQVTVTCVGDDTVTVSNATFTWQTMFSSSTDRINMGKAFSNQLTLKFINTNGSHDYTNNKISVSFLVYGDAEPNTGYQCDLLSEYKVSSVQTELDSDYITLVCYDRMAEFMNTEYNPPSSITSFTDIITDIQTQYGVTFSGSPAIPHSITASEIYECSVAEMMGYLAGFSGCNAIMSSYDTVDFEPVVDTTSSYLIERTQLKEDGVTWNSKNSLKISSVTANDMTIGTGYGVEMYHPYINSTELTTIYNSINNIEYYPANIEWFGDPTVELGQIVAVELSDGSSRNILVSQETVKFDGGYSSTIVSSGSEESGVAYQNTSPTDRKIAEVREENKNLEAKLYDAMSSIEGSNGGVFEITDSNSDGINDGWKIRNSDGTKYIVASVNGIGFKNDSTTTMALTTDGQINASCITTGTMNAERIAVNGYTLDDYFNVQNIDGTITVKIGDSANGLVLTQTGSRIAFSDTQGNDITYWDASLGKFVLQNLNSFIIGGIQFTEEGTGNLIIKGA